jgi:DNA-binding PadR family transcriptional regulator
MTNAELGILSLLAEAPRHGYEIEQTIESRGMREWTEIGFSSIYYLLNKLEAAGKIKSKHAASEGKGPGKRVFTITGAGKKSLHSGVLEALSVPGRCHLPIQIGLANLPILPKGEAREALKSYGGELERRRADLQATWDRQKPLPYFVEAMFEHSIALIHAEQEWVRRFVKKFDTQQQEGTGA